MNKLKGDARSNRGRKGTANRVYSIPIRDRQDSKLKWDSKGGTGRVALQSRRI